MHVQCKRFLINVRALFGPMFNNKMVLEIGSQDINGSPRFLFKNCRYTGIDIGPGKGVDCVSAGHLWLAHAQHIYDTIVTTEVAEHDQHWQQTFLNAMDLLKPGGLMIFTCAGEGRPEHGTRRTDTYSSPYTTDYYQNVTPEMIKALPNFTETWEWCRFTVNHESHDTQFIGFKKSGYNMRLLSNFKPSWWIAFLLHLCVIPMQRLHDFKNKFAQIKKLL